MGPSEGKIRGSFLELPGVVVEVDTDHLRAGGEGVKSSILRFFLDKFITSEVYFPQYCPCKSVAFPSNLFGIISKKPRKSDRKLPGGEG